MDRERTKEVLRRGGTCAYYDKRADKFCLANKAHNYVQAPHGPWASAEYITKVGLSKAWQMGLEMKERGADGESAPQGR